MVNFARVVYEYFFTQIYKKIPTNTRSDESQQLIERYVQYFQSQYKQSFGPEMIWFYVLYQFGRFQKTDFQLNAFVKEIQIKNIFGKTAITKFVNRRMELDDLTKKANYLSTYSINKQHFTATKYLTFETGQQSKVADQYKKQMNIRSSVKAAASSTEYALITCYDFTDLFNHLDPACQSCNSAVECKAMLKETYPHLYKLKGYGE